jgi:exopolyphosphatase/guanosine-5'-triphosphate,3'-diphosphate pyrophosphatase
MDLVRRAVIDIGTNSVKLLVAEVAGQVVSPLTERSEQTRLGRGFYEHHRLQPDAIAHTARAVAEFAAAARELNATSIRVIATSAARDSVNAHELTMAIQAASGLPVDIISGEREADWAFRGVLTAPGLAELPLLILDVGGGSTEFILGQHGHASFQRSFPLGTVRLLEKQPASEPPTAQQLAQCRAQLARQIHGEILPLLSPALAQVEAGRVQLMGTGGTTTILARMAHGMNGYDRERIESTRLSRAQVRARCEELWRLPLEARKQIPGLPANRADVILYGVVIYDALMEHFNFEELRISTRGLRYAAVLQPA